MGEDEDYADLNNCSSFVTTSGKCKGAEVLLKKTQALSVWVTAASAEAKLQSKTNMVPCHQV